MASISNQKNTKWLLPIVVIVWGLIIYKIVAVVNPPEQHITIPHRKVQELEKNNDNSKYTLLLSYIDPFLKTKRRRKKTSDNKRTKKKVVKKTVKTSRKKKIRLTYKGIIKTDALTYAIIDLANKSHIVQEQESIKEITILQITTDSIQIGVNTEQIWFQRK